MAGFISVKLRQQGGQAAQGRVGFIATVGVSDVKCHGGWEK